MFSRFSRFFYRHSVWGLKFLCTGETPVLRPPFSRSQTQAGNEVEAPPLSFYTNPLFCQFQDIQIYPWELEEPEYLLREVEQVV